MNDLSRIFAAVADTAEVIRAEYFRSNSRLASRRRATLSPRNSCTFVRDGDKFSRSYTIGDARRVKRGL